MNRLFAKLDGGTLDTITDQHAFEFGPVRRLPRRL
jgi:hypothetical protein